ncbi:hypothetical protein [Sphingomonas sp.]|uniref:hypothetical protein n=1 Tax=Sphingomonas sp. TaxID=28214 RepID=UPI003D6C8E7B
MDRQESNTELRDQIKKLMDQKYLTQDGLAEIAGKKAQTVSYTMTLSHKRQLTGRDHLQQLLDAVTAYQPPTIQPAVPGSATENNTSALLIALTLLILAVATSDTFQSVACLIAGVLGLACWLWPQFGAVKLPRSARFSYL